MNERQLATDEAELFGEIGAWTSGVELDLVADGAADQLVDRFAPEPAEEIQRARSTAEIAFRTSPLRP